LTFVNDAALVRQYGLIALARFDRFRFRVRVVVEPRPRSRRADAAGTMKNLQTRSNVAIMGHVEKPFQILFVSRIAAGCDVGIIRNIVLAARERNAARRISGALLFDGERFCELIEGPEADVRQLMQGISRDSRHTQVTVLFADSALPGRMAQRWVSGYCDAAAMDALGAEGGLRDGPALEAFTAVLAGADVA
jgi:hypothetical protein